MLHCTILLFYGRGTPLSRRIAAKQQVVGSFASVSGVTGLAQVQQPADTDLESVRRKLAYDLYYVRQVSLWMDLRIMGCTLFKVVGVPYHVLRGLFRMPSRYRVERAYRKLGGAFEGDDAGIASRMQLA